MSMTTPAISSQSKLPESFVPPSKAPDPRLNVNAKPFVSLQVPGLPPSGHYEYPLNHEQIERQKKFLSEDKYTLTPQDPEAGLPSDPIKFSIPELLSYLRNRFDARDIVKEHPWLIGGTASHVLTGVPSNDIDICYYVKKDELQFIYYTVRAFVRSKLGPMPGFKNEFERNHYIDRKYLHTKFPGDGFSIISLGDVDLKFILTGNHRLCVAATDGFHIPLIENPTKARCVDGFSWCDKEGFEAAFSNLIARNLVLKDLPSLRDIFWRVSHRMTQGYRINMVDGSFEKIAETALEQIKAEFPLNNDVKRKKFQRKLRTHQNNHFTSPLAKMIDFLNLLSFLHTNASANNRDAIHAYTLLLVEEWKNLKISDSRDPRIGLLDSLVQLIASEPGLTTDLLDMIKGLFFLGSINAPMTMPAYIPPFDKGCVHHPYIEMNTSPNKMHYLSISGSPIDIAQKFLKAWRKLEKHYSSNKDLLAKFLNLGISSGFPGSPLLSKELRYNAIQVMQDAFLRPPYSGILSDYFKGTPHATPALFFEFLNKELHDELGENFLKSSSWLQNTLLSCEKTIGASDPLLSQLIFELKGFAWNSEQIISTNDVNRIKNLTKILDKIPENKFQMHATLTECIDKVLKSLTEKCVSAKPRNLEFLFALGQLIGAAKKTKCIQFKSFDQITLEIVNALSIELENPFLNLQDFLTQTLEHLKSITAAECSKELSNEISKLIAKMTLQSVAKAAHIFASSKNVFDEKQMYFYLRFALRRLNPNENHKFKLEKTEEAKIAALCSQFIQHALATNRTNVVFLAGRLMIKLFDSNIVIQEEIFALLAKLIEINLSLVLKNDQIDAKSNEWKEHVAQLIRYSLQRAPKSFQQKLLEQVVTHVIRYLLSNYTLKAKLNFFSTFLVSIISSNAISAFPKELERLSALQNQKNLSLSNLITEFLLLGWSMKMDTLLFLIQPTQLKVFLNDADWQRIQPILLDGQRKKSTQDFLSDSIAFISKAKKNKFQSKPEIFDSLHTLLNEDDEIHSLAIMIQMSTSDKGSQSSVTFSHIYALLKQLADVNKLHKITSNPILNYFFGELFSSLMQHALTPSIFSIETLNFCQELLLLLLDQEILQENEACTIAESILQKCVTNSPSANYEYLFTLNTFLTSLQRWEGMSKELHTLMYQLQSKMSSLAIEAAEIAISDLTTSNTEEEAAFCLHLALKAPRNPDNDAALSTACFRFGIWALGSKEGFSLRLAYEIFTVALKNKIVLQPDHFALIHNLAKQLIDIPAPNREPEVDESLYISLGYNLKANAAIESKDQKLIQKTRGEMLKQIAKILYSTDSTEGRYVHFQIILDALNLLKVNNEVWPPEWDLVCNFTKEDLHPQSPSLIHFLIAAFRIEPIAAARIAGNNKATSYLAVKDLTKVRCLQLNYRIGNIAQDLFQMANLTFTLQLQFSIDSNHLQPLLDQKVSPAHVEKLNSSISILLDSLEDYLNELTDPPTFEELQKLYKALSDLKDEASFDFLEKQFLSNIDTIFSSILINFLQNFKASDRGLLLALEHTKLACEQGRLQSANLLKVVNKTFSRCSNEILEKSPVLLASIAQFLTSSQLNGLTSPEILTMHSQVCKLAVETLQKVMGKLKENNNFEIATQLLLYLLSSSNHSAINPFIASTCVELIRYSIVTGQALNTAKELAIIGLEKQIFSEKEQCDAILELAEALLNIGEFERKFSNSFSEGLILLRLLTEKTSNFPMEKFRRCIFNHIGKCFLAQKSADRKLERITGCISTAILSKFNAGHKWVVELEIFSKKLNVKGISFNLYQFLNIAFKHEQKCATQIALDPILKSRMTDDDFVLAQLLLIQENAKHPSTETPVNEFKLWQELNPLNVPPTHPHWTERMLASIHYINNMYQAKVPHHQKILYVVHAIIRSLEYAKGHTLSNHQLNALPAPLNSILDLLSKMPDAGDVYHRYYAAIAACHLRIETDPSLKLDQFSASILPDQIKAPFELLPIVHATIEEIQACLASKDKIQFKSALKAFERLLQYDSRAWYTKDTELFFAQLIEISPDDASLSQVIAVFNVYANPKKTNAETEAPELLATTTLYKTVAQAFVKKNRFIQSPEIWKNFHNFWNALSTNSIEFPEKFSAHAELYILIFENAAASSDCNFYAWIKKEIIDTGLIRARMFFENAKKPLFLNLFRHLENISKTISLKEREPYFFCLGNELRWFAANISNFDSDLKQMVQLFLQWCERDNSVASFNTFLLFAFDLPKHVPLEYISQVLNKLSELTTDKSFVEYTNFICTFIQLKLSKLLSKHTDQIDSFLIPLIKKYSAIKSEMANVVARNLFITYLKIYLEWPSDAVPLIPKTPGSELGPLFEMVANAAFFPFTPAIQVIVNYSISFFKKFDIEESQAIYLSFAITTVTELKKQCHLQPFMSAEQFQNLFEQILFLWNFGANALITDLTGHLFGMTLKSTDDWTSNLLSILQVVENNEIIKYQPPFYILCASIYITALSRSKKENALQEALQRLETLFPLVDFQNHISFMPFLSAMFNVFNRILLNTMLDPDPQSQHSKPIFELWKKVLNTPKCSISILIEASKILYSIAIFHPALLHAFNEVKDHLKADSNSALVVTSCRSLQNNLLFIGNRVNLEELLQDRVNLKQPDLFGVFACLSLLQNDQQAVAIFNTATRDRTFNLFFEFIKIIIESNAYKSDIKTLAQDLKSTNSSLFIIKTRYPILSVLVQLRFTLQKFYPESFKNLLTSLKKYLKKSSPALHDAWLATPVMDLLSTEAVSAIENKIADIHATRAKLLLAEAIHEDSKKGSAAGPKPASAVVAPSKKSPATASAPPAAAATATKPAPSAAAKKSPATDSDAQPNDAAVTVTKPKAKSKKKKKTK